MVVYTVPTVGASNGTWGTELNNYLGHVVRPAEIVVVASDAPDMYKSSVPAAYVCDGTDDHVQIQAAVDALGTIGGIVALSHGTFTVATTVVVDVDAVTIAGSGTGNNDSGILGTRINMAAGLTGHAFSVRNAADTAVLAAPMLANLTIYGGSNSGAVDAIHWRAKKGLVTNVHLHSLPRHGLVTEGYGTNDAVDNIFENMRGREVDGYGIKNETGAGDNHVNNCVFHDCGALAYNGGTPDYTLGGGIWTGAGWQINGGQIYACYGPGIYIDSARTSIIGTRIETCNNGIIVVAGEAPQIVGVKFHANCRTGNPASASGIVNDTGNDVWFKGGSASSNPSITGCEFDGTSPAGNNSNICIKFDNSSATNIHITGGGAHSAGSGGIITNTSNISGRIVNFRGFRTKATGSTAWASGTTLVVTHTLGDGTNNIQPSRGSITLQPSADPTVNYWVSAQSATTFTITYSGTPAAHTMYWTVERVEF